MFLLFILASILALFVPRFTCQTFDYIVVGGGTAGITIAARLAQGSHSVALVEAGGYYLDRWPFAKVPMADVFPVGSDPATLSPIDWGFVTTPQQGANGRRIHFARGKCLGGSSALNFMVYQRPSRKSLDLWAAAVNDSSYSFDNLLPFYQRSVGFTPPNAAVRNSNASVQYNPSAFNASGGPVHVSYPNYAMPFSTWMRRGMQGIGLLEASDFNSGANSGFQYCSSTIRPNDQTRSSSASSFLSSRFIPNLSLYSSYLAKRVLFDGQQNAVGVQVSGTLGWERNLTASKEVIVSAGAFQSPQLLMVSGIGPEDELKRHGIDVVSPLPGVGQNLWDHPFFGPSYRVNVETTTRVANDMLYMVAQYLRWLTTHSGPFTNPVGDFMAFEKIPQEFRGGFSLETNRSLAQFADDWPEAEYLSGAGFLGNVSNLLLNQPKDGYQHASIVGVIVAPTSRGNITLASADTADHPIVNPNWLTTESDQQLAIAMFKRIRQAFTSKEMAPIVLGDEYYPGIRVQTDEEILKYLRDNIMTLWHPACTCKMGTKDDPMAVIDNRARVFGVNRLRVVDASSFPFLPPGHPQSTVYMLAEKIADDILNAS